MLRCPRILPSPRIRDRYPGSTSRAAAESETADPESGTRVRRQSTHPPQSPALLSNRDRSSSNTCTVAPSPTGHAQNPAHNSVRAASAGGARREELPRASSAAAAVTTAPRHGNKSAPLSYGSRANPRAVNAHRSWDSHSVACSQRSPESASAGSHRPAVDCRTGACFDRGPRAGTPVAD
jgi:hypothetical protein